MRVAEQDVGATPGPSPRPCKPERPIHTGKALPFRMQASGHHRPEAHPPPLLLPAFSAIASDLTLRSKPTSTMEQASPLLARSLPHRLSSMASSLRLASLPSLPPEGTHQIPRVTAESGTMSSASLAARLLRRATASPPLSALAHGCANSSAPSRSPVPLPRFHADAAIPSSSGITTRRFLASQSPASSSKISADENLRRVIDSEIDCVVQSENGTSTQKIDLPEDFFFEIIDNPGNQSIILKREFAGETIKATVYTNFDAEEDLNEDEDDGNQNNEESFKPAIQMVVTVEKPEGPILEFDCNFNDDELAIENMRMLNRDNLDAENVYAGPPFSILDDSLQKALHRYLEVRGIKHSLHDWLYEYTMRKDEEEYVVWLKNMQEFIGT